MTEEALRAAFAGARVTIAGGLGFIGSNLARRLGEFGAEVLAVDALLPDLGGNRYNLDGARGRVAIEIADLRETDAIPFVEGREYLFNLAGQTSHQGSMDAPFDDLDLNCRVALRLLDTCRKVAPDIAVVFASTRQVYGKPHYLPVDERHPLAPVDVNGIHKLAAEAYHTLYREVYGIKSSVLRLTNTYGPRMRIKDGHQSFLGAWLRAVLEGAPFEVWEGEQLRDLTYVDDAVDALLLAAAVSEAEGGVFNIGGGRRVTLKRLADAVIIANGAGDYTIEPFPAARKRIDIGDYHADDRLFRRVTGWKPRVALKDGLARTLDYYRGNLEPYL
ncbi:MAG: NAD-dependent epimerase/dehydratase family protein [Alphaproteobacteria bacterium]|nr:NAD-dependent epimerase/dehydratase family protein [Alphaproteobacteria bacterium]